MHTSLWEFSWLPPWVGPPCFGLPRILYSPLFNPYLSCWNELFPGLHCTATSLRTTLSYSSLYPQHLTWVRLRGRPQLSCTEHQYQSLLSSLSLLPGILRPLWSRTIPFIMALSHLPPGTDCSWIVSGCDSELLSMTKFRKSRTFLYFFLCSAWTHNKLSTTTVWFWNSTVLLGCHHFNGVVLIAICQKNRNLCFGENNLS